MRERFEQLSLREKRAVVTGFFCLVFLLFYTLLWLPLRHHVEDLRIRVVKEKKLLQFVRDADQRLQYLQKSSQAKSIVNKDISLLTLIQHELNQTVFVSSLKELHQNNNETVQFSFENVEFDSFISWLTKLKSVGVATTRIHISASDTMGLVSLEGEMEKTSSNG